MYSNKSFLKTKRINLRKDQTEAERILWKNLRSKKFGVRFRRQYSIKSFIVDFYCHKLKLIIELDGWIHGEEENKKKDIIRQNILENIGYRVLRYRNEQVVCELDSALQNIWNYIQENVLLKDGPPLTSPNRGRK